YSAAHIDGRRAYDLARGGKDVVLAPRSVRIDRIDLVAYAWPDLELLIECGKGTYIRSIARDLGAALGVGGFVTALRRLRIGPFAAEDAVSLDTGVESVHRMLLPMASAVSGLPSIVAGPDDIRRLRNGLAIRATGAGEVSVLSESGDLVGIG